jgi:hypothetical protein
LRTQCNHCGAGTAALHARIAELESLLRDIYAAETPIDYLWCTPPWSDICDRLCELLPDVTTPKTDVEAT